MTNETLYSDSLVQIMNDRIVFEHYYYPSGTEKEVPFTDILRISVKPATLWNGKWRLHGTSNFKIWYPKDKNRPKRDRIFFATLKDQWVKIGFTVENGTVVERILKDKHLMKAV